MTLAKELVGGGFSPGQARAIGGGVNTALAAAGSSQATAAPITTTNTIVTGANGTLGVVLPAIGPGESVLVVNAAASTCPVYPPVGAAITVPGTGLGTTNAAYSQTLWAVCTYTCLSATQWAVQKSA